ncbi:unnamed protein product [Withania somnifera]
MHNKMNLNFIKLPFAFALIFVVQQGECQLPAIFYVTKYGAKPDSNEDISKSPFLELEIQDTLKAPPNPTQLKSDMESFKFLTNSIINDITSLDSKLFHINVLGCKNLTFNGINIKAPAESLKTDDDCISIGDGVQEMHITNVTCGPGHGISVGSLGKSPGESPVVGVFVQNCTFIDTDNGVRVKTWPASRDGVVRDLHFEDIVVQNISNPVVIDQVYCPYNQFKKELPSRVKISKVSFKNIKGTSSTQEAIQLICSKGVEIGDIDIKYSGNIEGPVKSTCQNVEPSLVGNQYPPVCTLTTPTQSS